MKYSIFPLFHAEAIIHRCVDSLLMQNYFDMEIILVNDGLENCMIEV